MAECSEVSAVKVFNYICGSGGVAELSHLLKHPSPLAKKTTAYEVVLWFEIQKNSDPENGLVLIKNQYGKNIGIRIDLKKQLCLKYTTTGSCRSGKRCKFWHLCKGFIEGTCKDTDCPLSHDFHDEDNREKTVELGFGSKPSGSLRGIVAGSFMQVCLMYLKKECIPESDNCPYLHICPNVIRAIPCECALSHSFVNPHNKCILGQHGFRPPRTSEVDVVRCNTLVPAKNQKPFEASKMNLHTKVLKGEPVRQAGLLQDMGKTVTGERAKLTSLTFHHDTAIPKADPLPEKVFNFICGKGGVASLSDLLQHPSPLAKKFAKPGQELDAKIWLQVEAQPEQGQRVSRIILLESQDGEIIGARVNSRKKICMNYSKGSCKSNNSCPFWHVCKSYLEGNCQGNCGLSHDFHDDGNVKKVMKLEMEKLPSGTLRSIVANSLPQVCQMYLKNNCQSSCCPYLHICSVAVQGLLCRCGLSHDLTDDHNTGILKQYDLAPEKTKFNIMQCNILIPKSKQQRIFEDKAYSASSQLLTMMDSPVPLMSLPIVQQHENALGPQSQGSSKSTGKKKSQRPRFRKKKTNQQREAAGESQHVNADDMEEESSDSVSDNEDVQDKPDLYSSSKFALDTNKLSPTSWQKDFTENGIDATTSMKPANKQIAQSNKGSMAIHNEPVSEMAANNVAAGVNLIDLFDDEALDDWEGVDASIDDLWTEPPLLSQVDEFFFSSSFSSNVAGSLSQSSTFSNPADQISPESNSEKSAVHSIFQYICKEHNGQVPYSLISQQQDLFPSEVIDIAAWFRENHNKFISIENSTGEIEAIRTHNTKARICFRYLMTKQGCKDPKCFRYHVCKHYLANGSCPLGKKCRFSHSHSLTSSHNNRITKQLKLNSFSEEQLRVLISASVPEVCLDHNRPSKGCKRGLRCIGIHICKHFVMGKCKKGDDCPFSHQNSLETPHSKLVLGRYNLTKVPPHAVVNALLIRQRQPSEKMREQPKTETAAQRRDAPQYICLDFILGHCRKEQLCDQYHDLAYNAPYMWQYNISDHQGDTWEAFTQSENEAIERQFCDVNVLDAEMEHIMIPTPPSVLIDPGEGQIKVNFDDMKAETGFGHVQLRRLSTKPAVSPTDHALSTQWVWYWLDEKSNSWREYGPELMRKIELKFSRGAPSFHFKERGEDFKLSFCKVPIYQQSIKLPVTINRVRRRPVFRSLSEIQRLQRPIELPMPLEPETPRSLIASAPGRVPSHWTSVPETEEFIRVSLPTSSDEFKLAESLFRQSMSENKAAITSIERVQNPFMWEKYARKKEQMEKKARVKGNPVKEKLLFHGTDFNDVDTICAENIDWRALDEDRAAQFGQGAYFTEEAALSNLYCKQDSECFRYVFLAEVLVGSFAKGEPSMKRPPPKDESAPKKELYDSCVDNVDKPTIFVLFDADQYYPSFLIKYKTKSKVVC